MFVLKLFSADSQEKPAKENIKNDLLQNPSYPVTNKKSRSSGGKQQKNMILPRTPDFFSGWENTKNIQKQFKHKKKLPPQERKKNSSWPLLFWNQVTELWETWSHSAAVAQLLEILCSQRGNARATRDSTPFWRNTEDPQGWPIVPSGRVFVRSGSCNFLVVCCRYSSWIECIERYIWHTDVFNVCMYDYSLCYILFHSATLTAKHLQCWGHSLFWEAFNQPWKRSILWFVQQIFENKLWKVRPSVKNFWEITFRSTSEVVACCFLIVGSTVGGKHCCWAYLAASRCGRKGRHGWAQWISPRMSLPRIPSSPLGNPLGFFERKRSGIFFLWCVKKYVSYDI